MFWSEFLYSIFLLNFFFVRMQYLMYTCTTVIPSTFISTHILFMFSLIYRFIFLFLRVADYDIIARILCPTKLQTAI